MKHKFIDIIGEGSFGSVYLIKDNKDHLFALKKILVDPSEVQQVLKQIEIMKKFTHQNLVKIYDSHYDQKHEQLQIVMEYCEEGNLLNYYKKKNKHLKVQEILTIFKQIVQAFIAVNLKGVFHNNLKPENILIKKGMIIKVADFGRARRTNHSYSQINDCTIDQFISIYASPQQMNDEKYTSKCDIWVIGCLLYFFYFGYHSFNSKYHNPLTQIKKLTYNKEIELPQNTDRTIAKMLSLTLIYQEKQRASWRQLWLSRLFADKIVDIQGYVDYLKNVTVIANWMSKQFWKVRKQFTYGKHKDQVFVYFMIKLQYTTMKMALDILKKQQKYRYLFDQTSFSKYEPNEQQFNDVKHLVHDHQKYFTSLKKSMKSQAIKDISRREMDRSSAFADIDNSIRTAYKILTDVKNQLEEGTSKEFKIWIFLSKWINFQKWFFFEHEPRFQKLIGEPIINLRLQAHDQIQRYELGFVQ